MSRYDYMTSSLVKDTATGNFYPDPLSLTYFDLQLSSTPVRRRVTPNSGLHFWQDTVDVYGDAALSDIILSINNIPHKNFLKPGDTLYFPAIEDIQKSFKKK